MSKNSNHQGKVKKQNKKSNSFIIIIAALLCVAVAVVFVVQKKGNSSNDSDNVTTQVNGSTTTSQNSTASQGDSNVQTISAGESLVIPVNEVSSTATFYPIEVDGTRMEVIVIKDETGKIRTAFNTCQVCYSSGRGYYVQKGNQLVCQNCGNRFTVNQIEVQSGGCNPSPIFEEDKTFTEDTIEIGYDFLQKSEKIFANWKTKY